MKHDYTNETIQAAIDAACASDNVVKELYTSKTGGWWSCQADSRLNLARELLERLPEPTFGGNLEAAIARMEAVDHAELRNKHTNSRTISEGVEAVRARLIAAAAREGQSKAVDWKAKYEEAQAKLDYVHNMGLRFGIMTSSDKPEPYLSHYWMEDSDHERMFREWSESIGWQQWQARAEKAEAELADAKEEVSNRQAALLAASTMIDELKAKSDRWFNQSKAENEKYLKAVEEIRLIQQSAPPQLRPIAEATEPVPEGCVRFTGKLYNNEQILSDMPLADDTHFADIRLTSPAASQDSQPAEVDPYAELKKAHAEGRVIQWHNGHMWHDLPHSENPLWIHPAKDYRIKPAPETFEAHGKVWQRHTPGDPMPCDGEALVQIIAMCEHIHKPLRGKDWNWEHGEIIGWRYADEPTNAWDEFDKTAGVEFDDSPSPWTPKVGDTVRLKSGGPVMTVSAFRLNGDVVCRWFDVANPRVKDFEEATLKPATKEEHP